MIEFTEGMEIAKAAGQLLYPHMHKAAAGILTSEDLWVRPGTFAD